MIRDDIHGAIVEQIPISFAGAGLNIVIPGVVGETIKVLQFFFTVAAATDITYLSGATPLSGVLTFTTSGSQVQDYMQLPLTCNEDDNFVMNSSAAVVVGGTIWYIQR